MHLWDQSIRVVLFARLGAYISLKVRLVTSQQSFTETTVWLLLLHAELVQVVKDGFTDMIATLKAPKPRRKLGCILLVLAIARRSLCMRSSTPRMIL